MATLRLCSIPGCGKPHRGHGWCGSHYERWRRHGDPLGGGSYRVPRGEVLRYFLEVVLPYSGADCLVWPFSTNRGYGQMRYKGQQGLVTRLVCEAQNGAAPSPSHHAAHSCGQKRCVSRHHLIWKTPIENEADKLGHGTFDNRRGGAKLTEAQAREILALAGTMPHKEIAARYGVARRTVGHLIKGNTWGSIQTAPA